MKSLYLLVLVGWTSISVGATVCPDFESIDQSQNPIDVFDGLILDQVLGDTECDSELCKEVAEWEKQDLSSVTNESVGQLLDSIRESAASLSDDEPGVVSLKAMLSEWQVLMAEANVEDLPTATWQPARFVLFQGHLGEINIEKIFLDNCPNTIAECPEKFRTATCIYTHAVLQRRVLVKLLEDNRDATIAYLRRLNLRWSAYNSGGRSLFPWELWANGALHQSKTESRGFVEPPSKQFLFLHPSIAISGQDSSDGDFEEAIVLELLGWYRWRWGGRNGASMERPFGASLITSWDGSNDLGYGLMVHLPKNWSIGVTRKSVNGIDETSVLVSVDLAKFLLGEQELRNKLIDKISAATQ